MDPIRDIASDYNHWLALARTGDTAAYGKLALAHQTKLYRFVLKYVRSTADARDLTQEALLQGFRCIDAFKGDSLFSTWLTGIALNLARNFIKRTPAGDFVEYEDHGHYCVGHASDDPVRTLQGKESLTLLSAAIADLPTDMKECLILISMEEFSYEEVAHTLGLPVGSVKSKVSRARQRLREALVECNLFD